MSEEQRITKSDKRERDGQINTKLTEEKNEGEKIGAR